MGLEVGDKAPDFTLKDTTGNPKTLYDLLGEKQVVLLFFPLAFSEICTKELCTVRDNMKLYNSLDATVAGISVDSFYTLREFKRANNLNFTLMSDFNKEVSQRYDAFYEDFYGMHGVSKRASFVISPDGIIEHREVIENAGELPDFDAILSAISG